MTDCLFCNIVSGEMDTARVYEDDHALAFLDINPSADGHVVVIPRTHYTTLDQMPEEEAAALFIAVHRVDRLVRAQLQVPATNIGLNNGKAAGQEIAHVHCHVMPRQDGDHGQPIQALVQSAQQDIADVHAQLTQRDS